MLRSHYHTWHIQPPKGGWGDTMAMHKGGPRTWNTHIYIHMYIRILTYMYNIYICKYFFLYIYIHRCIAGDSISGRRITWPGRLLFVDQEGRSPEGGPGRQLPVAFRVRLGVCPVGGGAIETEGWGVVQVGGMG